MQQFIADKIKRAIKVYLVTPALTVTKHGLVTKQMRDTRVISRKYLNRKLSNTMYFINYNPGGSSVALHDGLKLLVDEGFIKKLSLEEGIDTYNSKIELYKVL